MILTATRTCVLASALLVTACVSSSAVVCGDRTCPPDSTCDVPSGLCVPAGCGDEMITGIEECDGANLAGRDCTSFGFYEAGELGCSPVCTFDVATCDAAGFCGDHTINGSEACDGAPLVFETCADYGFDTGRLGCNSACSPAFANCDSVGWHVVAGEQLTPWRGIWGASDSNIFVVGDYGRVLRYDGTSWMESNTSTTEQLDHVWGSGPNDVFAVGTSGTIVHFDGAVWTTMTSPTTLRLRGVWGRSATDVYAVGDSGLILHYNGAAWTQDGSFPPHDLYAVYGSATRVIAVGAANINNAAMSKILRKEGAGAWLTDTVPAVAGASKYELHGVWGTGDSFVAVGGELGSNNGPSVLLTFDGATWTSVPTGMLGELHGVFATSPTDVIMGGHNGLLLRFDGTIVRRLLLDTTRSFSEMWGGSATRLFASSFGGLVWESDGTEWRVPAQYGAPTGDLADVTRLPSGDLLIVGENSQLITVTASVPTTQTVGTRDLAAVWDSGSAPGLGHTFVTTGGEGVWHRSPAGSFVNDIAGGFYADVHGTNESNVYAVGGTVNNPLVQRYNGSTWTLATLPANLGSRPQAVWAGGGQVFVVGSGGKILRSTDGVTFTEMVSSADSSITLRAVWGSGPTDVFAAGDNATIVHYDGVRWRRMTIYGSEVFLTIAGTGPTDVFVAGTAGVVHYDGVAWSRMEAPVSFNTTGAHADPQGALFTGFLGRVLSLDRVCQASEQRCGDPWDNDCDGALNCADTDCAGSAECARGGACTVDPLELGCNESRRVTTYSGVSRKDEWACLADSTGGTEVSLRFVAPASGQVTFTASEVVGEAQMLLLEADTVTSACDVTSCQAADASGSVTAAAVLGQSLYVVVDASVGNGAELTISTSCD